MSFGSAVAGKCADQVALLAAVIIPLAALLGIAGGVWIGRYSFRPYEMTADDINLMKDAAAVIGTGEPIAMHLQRLAERADGE